MVTADMTKNICIRNYKQRKKNIKLTYREHCTMKITCQKFYQSLYKIKIVINVWILPVHIYRILFLQQLLLEVVANKQSIRQKNKFIEDAEISFGNVFQYFPSHQYCSIYITPFSQTLENNYNNIFILYMYSTWHFQSPCTSLV